MIAELRGRLSSWDEDTSISAVIDVGGVGYQVLVPLPTLIALREGGDNEARLLVITQVREDAITLYGFTTAAERAMFRRLIQIQGVGPKIALALLSALGADGLAAAIARRDEASVSTADGVGKKLAQRVVAELADKVGAFLPAAGAVEIRPAVGPLQGDALEVVAALKGLGFGRTEADAMLAAVMARPEAPAGAANVIRACLEVAGRRLAAPGAAP